jgi:hypothetical protein
MGFRRKGNLKKRGRTDRSGGQGFTGEKVAALAGIERWRAAAECAC